ncbi:MAG: Gfo/Idh/MocA family oxidoreductase [Acidobacteriia bacterium]|nr:Gfo/Idh/MocA family oxidoreductase [Terriglobia bacterium]
MGRMVRFGIVGFGLHAVKRLMPGFRLARNARVTALSRRDADKATASAREYGIAHAFTSAEKLCRSPEVDAVFVATPNNCHLRDVLVALECGKPVLVEKPMAMNAAEARQMVEAARSRHLPFGVAQIFRFAESVRRLRERVMAGEIGRVVFARSEFSYSAGSHPRRWIHDAAIAGGGPIADVGVHCVDALRFILNDEVASVSACGLAGKTPGTVESAAAVSLQFRRCGIGVVLVSARTQYRTPLEIVGEGGVLRAEDAFSVEKPVMIERQRADGMETEQVSNHLAYARQVEAFADAVEARAAFPVPGEEGLKNQVILDAAYGSMRSGSVEEIVELATGG